ncbi:hypothetical protein BDZ91DRAFT_185192 [Kalaharituber pfeilii]|nr:hypothetical protein BDZ91DRAFT_185192 [Kalaharituber pfeilii]
MASWEGLEYFLVVFLHVVLSIRFLCCTISCVILLISLSWKFFFYLVIITCKVVISKRVEACKPHWLESRQTGAKVCGTRTEEQGREKETQRSRARISHAQS